MVDACRIPMLQSPDVSYMSQALVGSDTAQGRDSLTDFFSGFFNFDATNDAISCDCCEGQALPRTE
jgi:hypothetical protein